MNTWVYDRMGLEVQVSQLDVRILNWTVAVLEFDAIDPNYQTEKYQVIHIFKISH